MAGLAAGQVVLPLRRFEAAAERAVEAHERIDVLVNNAGYSLHGPFEESGRDQIARQHATRVKLVEPGVIHTDFYARSADQADCEG